MSQYTGLQNYGGYSPFLSLMPTLSSYGTTYTAPSGGTNQGAQLQQLTDLLSKITNAPPQAYSSAQLKPVASQAQAQAAQMQGGANQYAQNIQSQNFQNSAIPGLMGQYGNLSQMFQLWQADKGFSNQFTNQSPNANINPYTNQALQAASAQGAQQLGAQNQADISKVSNMTTPNQPGATITPPTPSPTGETANPFLGSTQSVIDSTSNLPTPPSVATAEMGTQLNAGTNMLNLINSLINAQQGVVQNATQTDVASYQDKMNTLNTIANALGNALSSSQTNQANAINIPGTKQNAAATYQTLKDNFVSQMQALGKNPTPDGFWYFLNSQKNALSAQGVNVDELYTLQAQDRNELGGNGDLTSGAKGVTKPLSTAKTASPKAKIDSKGNVLGYTTADGKFHAVQESGGILGIGAQKVLRVKNNKTGQTGTIPVNEFDPSEYTLL